MVCELCSCALSYLFWGYIIYKLLDWVIRKPYLRGRLHRHIFVTGCDTGFGHEISKRLDRTGYNVISGCLTERGEEILKKQSSARLKTVHLDVTSKESIEKAYEFVKKSLPEGKGLWGLINNAGISGKIGPTAWLELDDYHECLAVNLFGVVEMSRVFLPLIKKEKGRIVNTASIFGRTSLLGGVPYTISKYGVEAFSDGLRREMREYGCSVHLIEPGFHKTNIASGSNLEKWFDATWNKLSPELKEEYGQEYFDKAKDLIVHKFVDKIASDRISDVVDAYEHALLAVFPRARYVVGMDAKLFWLPVQWMPEWLGDLILSKANKDRPIPAVLKKKQ